MLDQVEVSPQKLNKEKVKAELNPTVSLKINRHGEYIMPSLLTV